MKNFWKIIVPVLVIILLGIVFLFARQRFGSQKMTLIKSPETENSLQDYYQTAQRLAQSTTQTSTTTFLAVGDIMLSREVAAAIQKENNINYPFIGTADLLKSTDFNFGNLESPFYFNSLNYEDKSSGIIGGRSLIFGSPITNMEGLTNFNFKDLNLANNHAFDQGLNGLIETKNLLAGNNLQNEGTGGNLDEAWQPGIVASNGIKICFIGASYASANDGGKSTNNYVARIGDAARLKASIVNAKSLCDYTVVTMHAGTEYTRTPNEAQTTFAHTAINDGADMVIGSHPHWVQTVEKYNGKYIFYSLGNFIFDQSFSRETSQGLALKIIISKNQAASLQGPHTAATLSSIELIPVIIQNSQPRPATSGESQDVLKAIDQMQNVLYP